MVLKAFQKFHPITPDLKPGCNTKAPAVDGTIWNALRVALRIISGKIIYNFAILENPRIFQNCLFTGGVVEGNGSCSAAFCKSAALRAGACSPLGELSRSD